MSKFRYLNLNPYKKKTGDCVIRAIACALGIDWEEASDLLYSVARNIGCEMSCIGCYSSLFRELRLKELPVQGKSVGDTADSFPENILLIRIQGHLTCARYGCIFDIWDCRNEIVDRAWLVE